MRLTAFTAAVIQALPAVHSFGVHRNSAFSSFRLYQQPEWSDFDDFVGDETANLSSFFASRPPDNSACSTRQFSLGADLILSDFVGNMGFEEGACVLHCAVVTIPFNLIPTKMFLLTTK
jgi:hypothetical protein